MRLFLGLLLAVSFGAAAQYDEPWRPAFHFTPPAKWMNDPNGLVYYNGKYHLFYQHYPNDIVWGPMHWGHAVSKDLLHWEHLPIALYPDSLGWIFSGSAVIDKNNTAGFGKNAMVAIFTYHNDAIWKSGRKNTESQGIAYSLDEGKTFTKYKGNPVLNNSGEQDFRDPKVSWNTKRKCWIMVLAAGDRIKIYASPNLKQWAFESDFIPDVKEPYGVWECPDLFPIKVGKTEKWVLILSQNMHGPNGGSATRYIIGDFNGRIFKALTQPQWIDHGTDYYAAVTYDNVPDGKRILLGWMSNWLYADKTPTNVWRSAMALPRELALVKTASSYYLNQSPISFLGDLTSSGLKPATSSREGAVYHTDLSSAWITFDMSDKSSVILSNAKGERVSINMEGKQLTVDRSQSGVTGFSSEFAGKSQTIATRDPVHRVQLMMDRSSIEISINDGTDWMTIQFFPTQAYTEVVTSGDAVNLTVRKVKSIWENRD